MIIIGDTKIRSPFKKEPSEHVWRDRLVFAIEYADWIAVHTDTRWGGSPDLIRLAKIATDKPILAKGIHTTDKEVEELIQLGADYVLVVGRIPADHLIDKCIMEVTCLDEFSYFRPDAKLAWNARNLVNGLPKVNTFGEAREHWSGWLCQASMIKCQHDIYSDADAIMVGEHLELLKNIRH